MKFARNLIIGLGVLLLGGVGGLLAVRPTPAPHTPEAEHVRVVQPADDAIPTTTTTPPVQVATPATEPASDDTAQAAAQSAATSAGEAAASAETAQQAATEATTTTATTTTTTSIPEAPPTTVPATAPPCTPQEVASDEEATTPGEIIPYPAGSWCEVPS